MKQIFIKTVVMILILSLLSAVSCGASGTVEIVSFSDVTTEHWGYQTIMSMTGSGLFKGTTEPVNGVGTFSPESVMTRAEFVTVSLRAVLPEQAKAIGNDSGKWWKGYYDLALANGILLPAEFENGDLDKKISRQEMAMIMVRCVEKNGESLAKRVATTQIADYATINEYYRNYVRDSFSYGLINGVDLLGTFAPTQSLTRAQAATVLCRLLDKTARVKVEFPQEQGTSTAGGGIGSGSGSGTGASKPPSGGATSKPSGGIVVPPSADENEKPVAKYPWEEENAKKPSEYTLDDYIELSDEYKDAFYESFETAEAYDKWMNEAKDKVEVPWKTEAKQPVQYTIKEYDALTPAQKIIFQESFEKIEAFEEWLIGAQDKENKENLPWEKDGRQPSDYTWAEYEALSAELQMIFQNTFESIEAFDAWKERVNPEISDDKKLPWEQAGAIQPSDYTWEMYNLLDAELQMAFQNAFESIEAFDEWRRNAQGDQEEFEEIPWENGEKLPIEYGWEEYAALSGYLQMKFQEYFESIEAFDEWMRDAQADQEEFEEIPWENGEKLPTEYSWEEYEALSGYLQMKFQEYFESIEAFDEWMRDAQADQEELEEIPWENGEKLPSEYSWEEYEALSGYLQMKFQEYFESIEAFDEWMVSVQPVKKMPWEEEGAKQPSQYTWEEFNELTGEEQMAFFNSFESFEEFDAWLAANDPGYSA